jgi:hypothetical protein
MDLTFIGTAFASIEKAAASVYHQVLATGESIHSWEASNPVVGPLVQSGLDYASGLLERVGVPVGTIELVGEDIIAGLKQLAAQDATVPSVATVTTVASAIVGAADPAVAPIADAAAAVVNAAEHAAG